MKPDQTKLTRLEYQSLLSYMRDLKSQYPNMSKREYARRKKMSRQILIDAR